MSVSIEKLMGASFGEASETIRATYKKTVLIRQYETEVIELETTLKMDKPMTNAERMFISAALQAQLEYTAYSQLLVKGLVTATQFNSRKAELENALTILKEKAEGVLNKSLDEYIDIKID